MANDVPPETPRDVFLLLLDKATEKDQRFVDSLPLGVTKVGWARRLKADRQGWLARYDAAVAREKPSPLIFPTFVRVWKNERDARRLR